MERFFQWGFFVVALPLCVESSVASFDFSQLNLGEENIRRANQYGFSQKDLLGTVEDIYRRDHNLRQFLDESNTRLESHEHYYPEASSYQNNHTVFGASNTDKLKVTATVFIACDVGKVLGDTLIDYFSDNDVRDCEKIENSPISMQGEERELSTSAILMNQYRMISLFFPRGKTEDFEFIDDKMPRNRTLKPSPDLFQDLAVAFGGNTLLCQYLISPHLQKKIVGPWADKLNCYVIQLSHCLKKSGLKKEAYAEYFPFMLPLGFSYPVYVSEMRQAQRNELEYSRITETVEKLSEINWSEYQEVEKFSEKVIRTKEDLEAFKTSLVESKKTYMEIVRDRIKEVNDPDALRADPIIPDATLNINRREDEYRWLSEHYKKVKEDWDSISQKHRALAEMIAKLEELDDIYNAPADEMKRKFLEDFQEKRRAEELDAMFD